MCVLIFMRLCYFYFLDRLLTEKRGQNSLHCILGCWILRQKSPVCRFFTGVRTLLPSIKWCLFFTPVKLYPLKHTFSLLFTTHSTAQWALSVSLAYLLPSFSSFSPQTRRTFKVFSDNVTVVVHLFPIRCNLPGQLGKFSFIFILHFSLFVPFVFFVCLTSSWHTVYSVISIFMSQCQCHHMLLAALSGW